MLWCSHYPCSKLSFEMLQDATESTWQSSGSPAIPSKLSSQQHMSGPEDIGTGKALLGT